MERSIDVRTVLLVLCTVTLTGCNSSPISPSSPATAHVNGRVLDDSRYLPGALGLVDQSLPVEGARVEVLDGPDKGRAVLTGPDGRFDLGQLNSGVRVGATKPGWEPADPMSFFANVGRDSVFFLSQAPHVLSGQVHGPGRDVVPGARVELFDGPNAGRVVFAGSDAYFTFEGLKTSSVFWIEFSSPGYHTERLQVGELRSNYFYSYRLKRR